MYEQVQLLLLSACLSSPFAQLLLQLSPYKISTFPQQELYLLASNYTYPPDRARSKSQRLQLYGVICLQQAGKPCFEDNRLESRLKNNTHGEPMHQVCNQWSQAGRTRQDACSHETTARF